MIEIKKEMKETTIYNYYCDICKKEIKPDVDNCLLFYINRKKGIKEYNYDICPNCMKKVIFTYVKEKSGSEPRIEEY